MGFLKYNFEECGYEFKAMPTNVQQGKWCPKCKGKKGWATRRKK